MTPAPKGRKRWGAAGPVHDRARPSLYPVGATSAGGTGVADQQSSIAARSDELIAPRRPFAEGGKRKPLVEERLQHPARFGLATGQDAVEVGRATRERGAKALAVGKFATG